MHPIYFVGLASAIVTFFAGLGAIYKESPVACAVIVLIMVAAVCAMVREAPEDREADQ